MRQGLACKVPVKFKGLDVKFIRAFNGVMPRLRIKFRAASD